MIGHKPSLKAILVCDSVLQEIGTAKKSIIGIFDQILAGSFPCSHPQMGIYFSVIDAEGSYFFRMESVRLSTNEIIAKGEIGPILVKNRFQIVDGAIMLQGLTFPAPGKYEFRLYANDAFLDSKELTLRQAGQL